jgi:outer membrane protein
MKKLLHIALAVAATAAFTVPLAQTRATRIGFVNAQTVLQQHPQGKNILDQRKKAEDELKPLQTQITTLQQKIAGGTATAAERQQYETLVKSYQARVKALSDRQNKLLEPITKEVDAAVSKVAKAQGFVLVMDRLIAQQSGLVIYADPDGTDLTDDVVAEVKK